MLGLATGLLLVGTPTLAAGDERPSASVDQVRAKIQVKGSVVDVTGEPLPGATVLEPATGNGAITDIDGNFAVSVSADAVLEVSFVGFETQRVPVKGRRELKIVLQEDDNTLSEVVVVGYGIQKKVNLSGSVDQINAKDLEKRPIADLSRGLQGMIPNLNIDFTSGEPGQAANINIRGEASINGGSPLILIDGVAADAEEMNRLLPEDIESLSVLKDYHHQAGSGRPCAGQLQRQFRLETPVNADREDL